MTGKTTTGPLIFGRWSQPAALTNAGFIPPDPYPLEKILFCASCGQQFFGTHQTGGDAHTEDGAQPGEIRVTGTHLISTDAAEGAHIAGGVRVYRTACDCRPGPLPADDVELRVYAEAHVLAFGTDTISGVTSTHYAVLAIRIFSRVEIGPTLDHISFTSRI